MKRILTIIFFLVLSLFFANESVSQSPLPLNHNIRIENIQGENFVHLPIMLTPAVDLTIDRLEITQAIQNINNNVLLIEDRPTIVRVYSRAQNGFPIEDVFVSLNAKRNGISIGTLMVGPTTITPSPMPGLYASTTNFNLSPDWLSGDIVLTAKIDPNGLINEYNENNNSIGENITFNAVPPLSMKLVPINYTHSPNGTFFPATTSDTVSSWIIHTFPLSEVNVSIRAPINLTANLSDLGGWIEAIQKIRDAKISDGAPDSQVYYGVLPRTNPNGDTYLSIFSGYALIGSRAGVGLEMDMQTAAHEVAHNFGLLHAPCGNPSGQDPNFPYPNGSIGLFGLDVFDERVWTPNAPDNAKDFMSYCGPQWISDYHYVKLYLNQIANGFSTQTEAVDGLYIRVNIDAENNPTFKPIYELTTTPSLLPQNSDYELQLLDIQGNILESYPVLAFGSPPEIDINGNEIENDIRSIAVVVPAPAQSTVSVRLVGKGNVLGHKTFGQRIQPSYVTISPPLEPYILEWDEPGWPTLIRIESENEISWTTLGIDNLDGNIMIDPSWISDDDVQFEILYGR